ncbi:MAG: SDR family NAD(P)-dependent oxidoreductase [Planctomycetota bacterium]|nr:SDR family NAD(P)-dependent oxidoreductase [Planctomycetota bacterium]
MSGRFDLSGKVALITGGSQGLGKAMARGLVEQGAKVILASRDEAKLRKSLDEVLLGTTGEGRILVVDLAKRGEAGRLAKEAEALWGRVDILVNNAGSNRPEAIDRITDEAWDQIVELNLTSVMALTRSVAKGMKERGWGRVIHIASIMATVSKEGRNTYSATKSALLGLARANALDLGPFGITVNCLSPGPFLTELPGKLLSDADKAVFAAHTALGRWGQPDELVGAALLLASPAGAYITGTNLIVDGGYLCR